MNYSCNQEIAQDLLLNWNYDKHELACEIGIRITQLDYLLSGNRVKEKKSLSSKLKKISNRYKQQKNNEHSVHATRSRKSILKTKATAKLVKQELSADTKDTAEK